MRYAKLPGVQIAGQKIAQGGPPFVVAEISGNHRGRLEEALQLVDVAADAGANAVKLQTYTADTITLDSDRPEFLIGGGPWAGRRLYELYQEAHTPWEWHEKLFERGLKRGVPVFSSPFDGTAVDLLERLHTPAYKIASFEIVDLELIEQVSRTDKPVIISTGMATVEEINAAVDTARAAGCSQLALLHCNSGYPTPDGDANLRTIAYYAEKYQCPVGYSDHTLGIGAAVAAVALGAPIIEKHVTLSRAAGGPDAAFSAEPSELRSLVEACRSAHSAVGHVRQGLTPSEEESRVFRPSLWVIRDVPKGRTLSRNDVESLRPGHGMAPRYLSDVIGGVASRDLVRGTPLAFEDIES
jgi:N-acetylneuraminate synthase